MNKALDLLREIRPSIPKEVLELWCKDRDAFLASHPAVEQAGANVGHGHVFPRADGVKMRCGGPGLCSECTADASRARAALAQPSPKCATCGGTGMVDDGEITCSEGGIPYENGPVKCVKDCPDCKAQPSPAQAEQAEAERPTYECTMGVGGGDGNLFVHGDHASIKAAQKIVMERDAALARVAELEQKSAGSWTVDTSCGRPILMYEGCSVIEDQTAYEVIRMIKWFGELEKQEPVALANRGLHAFWVKWTEAAAGLYGPGIKLYAAPVAQAQQLHDLDKQCRDDVARALGLRPNQERGFAWSYLLASIKSCVKASEDSAQAQHSVPEEFIGRLSEFLAQRGTTGKALLRELRAMLAAAPAQGGE
ncbi:TPA: hypothetical protein ACLESY_002050 [Pseudomonas aeruginosa]